MIQNPFSYTAPDSIAEAFSLLSKSGSEVFTGDQAFIGNTKTGHARPSTVVSLRNIPGLNSIIQHGDQLIIGSSVSFSAMLADAAIGSVPVLVEALRAIKDPHLKNHSNVGGALYHRSTSHGPLLAALLSLDASVSLSDPWGDKNITLENYLTAGSGQGEIIKSVTLTINRTAAGSFRYIDYLKVGKIVCGAAVVLATKGETISKISVAACGCVSIPVRLRNLENSLTGVKVSRENIEAALHELPTDELTLSNVNISNPSYLFHLLKVLIKRAVLKS
jgi:CO/xanthine dehydrogenase FAD-binding subunit